MVTVLFLASLNAGVLSVIPDAYLIFNAKTAPPSEVAAMELEEMLTSPEKLYRLHILDPSESNLRRTILQLSEFA